MNGARAAARILIVTGVVLMVVGVMGFVATLLVNAFVLDKYNAYGEVPIPGSGRLHLPAGEVAVSLHTRVISSPTGTGLPVPRLGLTIVPPPGVADPQLTESFGSTTTVNNDTHRRVWLMQVAAEGDYQISTDGQVGGFITPRLAFGTAGSHHSLVWMFAVLFGVGLLDLIYATWWSVRRRRRPQQAEPGQPAPATTTEAGYTPTDEGVKLEQLKTIAALRDSGALTEAEFQAEKRRILGGR